MSAPVHSTLTQVATNSSAGVTMLPGRATRIALASDGIWRMRREQFPELRRQPLQLALHVCLDHAELRLDTDVPAAQLGIVLDADAVEQRPKGREPRAQLARVA